MTAGWKQTSVSLMKRSGYSRITPWLYVERAHARLAADDIQGAVVLCKREPRSADAAQMLGDLYTLLGDEGAARKEYESLKLLNMKMQLSKDPGGTCSIIGGASNWYKRRANQLSRGDYLQDSEHSR